jgi:hypothetical protein
VLACSTTCSNRPQSQVLGPGEVAFLIGPVPRKTIAFAAVSTGRITRRIAFDKGRIDAMAASPDGSTIYCVAGGMVWAVPVSVDTSVNPGGGASVMVTTPLVGSADTELLTVTV